MATPKTPTATDTKSPAPKAPKAPKAPSAAGLPPPVPQSFSLSLGQLDVRPGNMRTHFDETEAAQLAESMRTQGQLAPVLVTEAPGGRFVLVAGERRVRAARALGWSHVAAIALDKAGASEAAIAENFKRADVSHADRCRYVAACRKAGESFAVIGARLGKSEQTVTNDAGIAAGLLPEIFDAWARAPKASKIALEIYSKPADEQRAKWAAWLGKSEQPKTRGKGKAATAPAGEPADGSDGAARRGKKELGAVYTELDRLSGFVAPGGEEAHFLTGALWAFRFMAATSEPVPAWLTARIDALKNPRQAKLFG